ncbi:hypothetical protein QVH35_09130 [Candidatus Nitrosotenuis chungbukensis]|uniref:hypothetical protein n=1 Tax=Candidatus Nitrosotenuis chungbukensis TaxID=1353246 RepID=UPI0005B29FDD|nr:hypothetical protein [Candidatus Nitrosotenuis chungbukensis]WKT57518.1 hypothetical protein QVH35_09130 [Candidatus Nitrosotenuis chungbukensis]
MSEDLDPIRMIRLLLDSDVINYLESSERLYLSTYLQKTQSNNLPNSKESETVQRIFRKYRKYL